MVSSTPLSLLTYGYLALLWQFICIASSLSLRPFRDDGLYYIFIAADLSAFGAYLAIFLHVFFLIASAFS